MAPTTRRAADDSTPSPSAPSSQSTQDGFITGIRFYKGDGNTGAHIGTLYTASGRALAQANFANESATGWQTVTFASAVPVTAGTTYVAAYYAPNGHYAADDQYFFGYRGYGPGS